MQVKTVLKPGCVICKRNCGANKLQKCSNIDSVRITRHLKKIIDKHDFIILEDYRCMPLLGDEEKIPNWDVHIVKFTIVFVEKKMEDRIYYNKYF